MTPKYVLVCLAAAVASSSWAAIDLTVKVETNGVTTTRKLRVEENRWTSFSGTNVALRIKANERSDAALVKLELRRGKAGARVLLAKPELIARWNEPAKIAVGEADGTLRYRITVTPRRR